MAWQYGRSCGLSSGSSCRLVDWVRVGGAEEAPLTVPTNADAELPAPSHERVRWCPLFIRRPHRIEKSGVDFLAFHHDVMTFEILDFAKVRMDRRDRRGKEGKEGP